MQISHLVVAVIRAGSDCSRSFARSKKSKSCRVVFFFFFLLHSGVIKQTYLCTGSDTGTHTSLQPPPVVIWSTALVGSDKRELGCLCTRRLLGGNNKEKSL